MPAEQPKTVRKRRSDTNVSELERRDHGGKRDPGGRPPQEVAQAALEMDPPTPSSSQRVSLSQPRPVGGDATPRRVRPNAPRRREPSPEPPRPSSTQEVGDNHASKVVDDKKHDWDPNNRPRESQLLPESLRDDVEWLKTVGPKKMSEELPRRPPPETPSRAHQPHITESRYEVEKGFRTSKYGRLGYDDDDDDLLEYQHTPPRSQVPSLSQQPSPPPLPPQKEPEKIESPKKQEEESIPSTPTEAGYWR